MLFFLRIHLIFEFWHPNRPTFIFFCCKSIIFFIFFYICFFEDYLEIAFIGGARKLRQRKKTCNRGKSSSCRNFNKRGYRNIYERPCEDINPKGTSFCLIFKFFVDVLPENNCSPFLKKKTFFLRGGAGSFFWDFLK